MKILDEQFDQIIQDAIKNANAIECDIEDYIAGLKGWLEEIQIAIAAAQGN